MDKYTYIILNALLFAPIILIFLLYRNILIKKLKFFVASACMGIIYFFIVDVFSTRIKAWEYDYTKTLRIRLHLAVFEEMLWMILVFIAVAMAIEIYLEKKAHKS